jgi:hypothetical protein
MKTERTRKIIEIAIPAVAIPFAEDFIPFLVLVIPREHKITPINGK